MDKKQSLKKWTVAGGESKTIDSLPTVHLLLSSGRGRERQETGKGCHLCDVCHFLKYKTLIYRIIKRLHIPDKSNTDVYFLV